MASSALAFPIVYHKPTPTIRKSKLESTKVRSEDELLKFFLHGSYDVQRGNVDTIQLEENPDKTVCVKDEATPLINSLADDKKGKSRCMFEETYMINISVKQPDTIPSSKQIDVRIEKAPVDAQMTNDKVDVDEISSIFDEDDNDEVDSVIFNEINTSPTEIPSTSLTLADMINKSLTTIPALSTDNLNKTNTWYVDKPEEIKSRKASEDLTGPKIMDKVIKTPPPIAVSSTLRPVALTTTIRDDEKLFEYLDYLETKGERKSPIKISNMSVINKSPKSASPISKTPPKQLQHQHESIPIIDLEQLCRSLNVHDLKDELIRKKIYELKNLIDERHRKQKSHVPIITPRKDNLPILIALPPVVQQRRKTTVIQPPTLLKSETIDLQAPYESSYHDIISNYNSKHSFSPTSNKQQYARQQITTINSSRKYQHT